MFRNSAFILKTINGSSFIPVGSHEPQPPLLLCLFQRVCEVAQPDMPPLPPPSPVPSLSPSPSRFPPHTLCETLQTWDKSKRSQSSKSRVWKCVFFSFFYRCHRREFCWATLGDNGEIHWDVFVKGKKKSHLCIQQTKQPTHLHHNPEINTELGLIESRRVVTDRPPFVSTRHLAADGKPPPCCWLATNHFHSPIKSKINKYWTMPHGWINLLQFHCSYK